MLVSLDRYLSNFYSFAACGLCVVLIGFLIFHLSFIVSVFHENIYKNSLNWKKKGDPSYA